MSGVGEQYHLRLQIASEAKHRVIDHQRTLCRSPKGSIPNSLGVRHCIVAYIDACIDACIDAKTAAVACIWTE